MAEFPISEYRCGARAGELVRCGVSLSSATTARGRLERFMLPGRFGRWCEALPRNRGSFGFTSLMGTSQTWSDDEEFWNWFERIPG